MSRRGRYLAGVAVPAAATVVVSGLAGGCASSTLPAELSPEQRALIDSVRFDATVGVERYEYPVYSDRLTEALRQTRLFARVESLEDFVEPPALVARVARTIYGTAAIPLPSILTLGIIPTTVEEEHGHAFWLEAGDRRASRAVTDAASGDLPGHTAQTGHTAESEAEGGAPSPRGLGEAVTSGTPRDSVLVDFSYRGPSTLGWVSILLNLSSDRTAGDVYEHPRFYRALAYAVVSQAPRIRQLASQR